MWENRARCDVCVCDLRVKCLTYRAKVKKHITHGREGRNRAEARFIEGSRCPGHRDRDRAVQKGEVKPFRKQPALCLTLSRPVSAENPHGQRDFRNQRMLCQEQGYVI